MADNSPTAGNGKNHQSSPQKNSNMDKLFKCWYNKIISIGKNLASLLRAIVLAIRNSISLTCNSTVTLSTETLSTETTPIDVIIPDTSFSNLVSHSVSYGFAPEIATAAESDLLLFGDADVGRNIFIDWHVCSHPGCKKRNVISEFDIEFPPNCQNTQMDPHKFIPSRWKELKGGDDSCSEIS